MIIVERRKTSRVRVNLDVVIADQSSQHKGTISDISVDGCFILSRGEAATDEPITVTIELPSKKTVRLTGEVVYNTPEIGFAMRFKELPASAMSFIEKIIKRFSQTYNQPGQTIQQQ